MRTQRRDQHSGRIGLGPETSGRRGAEHDTRGAHPLSHSPGRGRFRDRAQPRAKLEILGAILLALFLFALDQTVVGTALPRIVTDLHGNEPLHVGRHDLPADGHDQRPDLRQAVRPVRPAADRHLRGRACSSWRPIAGRAQPGDVAVHPVPRPPGPGRRRRLPGRPRRGRGPVHAGRARQVPRPVRSRVRALVARRARPSAGSSPTTSAGTGSSSSTCRSGWSRSCILWRLLPAIKRPGRGPPHRLPRRGRLRRWRSRRSSSA